MKGINQILSELRIGPSGPDPRTMAPWRINEPGSQHRGKKTRGIARIPGITMVYFPHTSYPKNDGYDKDRLYLAEMRRNRRRQRNIRNARNTALGKGIAA